MEIKNPVFLKRPWLFPVCSIMGGAFVFRPGIDLSPPIKFAAFLVGVLGSNAAFFIALKRTRQSQKHDPPPTIARALRKQTFVCLECGTVIDRPEGTNVFLKCTAGHRVQVVKTGPLWRMMLASFWITVTVLVVAIHLFQTVWLTGASRAIVWAILAASLAWSGYLGLRGKAIMNEPAPFGTLGRQYIFAALSRTLAAAILAAMAAAQISY